MTGEIEIQKERLEREFELSELIVGKVKIQYASLRTDPSCVFIINEYRNGTYRLTECQEGEYGLGIIGRSNLR